MLIGQAWVRWFQLQNDFKKPMVFILLNIQSVKDTFRSRGDILMTTEELMDQIDRMPGTFKAGTMEISNSHGAGIQYITIQIKDYTLYTETEKDVPIPRDIGQHLFVHITY